MTQVRQAPIATPFLTGDHGTWNASIMTTVPFVRRKSKVNSNIVQQNQKKKRLFDSQAIVGNGSDLPWPVLNPSTSLIICCQASERANSIQGPAQQIVRVAQIMCNTQYT